MAALLKAYRGDSLFLDVTCMMEVGFIRTVAYYVQCYVSAGDSLANDANKFMAN